MAFLKFFTLKNVAGKLVNQKWALLANLVLVANIERFWN